MKKLSNIKKRELRNRKKLKSVSTNRYSVPGFPALYLGDTTYVCWEEFNKFRIRDLWFSVGIFKYKPSYKSHDLL